RLPDIHLWEQGLPAMKAMRSFRKPRRLFREQALLPQIPRHRFLCILASGPSHLARAASDWASPAPRPTPAATPPR
ncbi:hypothetical protein F7R03_28820, partial [Pseudomonas palleroniana]